VGTWCFNASYAATPGGNYTDVPQQSDTECFSVTAAPSSSTTTASPGSVVIGPTGTATDSVAVRGNPAGGAPTGSVAFTVCGPLPGPALCPSGTAVPPTPVTLSPGTGITSSATSGAFTPTSVGTWCFAAVYTPDPGSNYQGSSDNISGTADSAECLSVSAATPSLTTAILAPSKSTVGNTWGDTATVAGNSAGGPPTGTISWTLCKEPGPTTPCSGGTPIGSTSTSTTTGDDSTFDLPTPQDPTPTLGTYCFNASFAATPGSNYNNVPQQSGAECFSVIAAPSSSATTASPGSVVIGPTGTATDSVTVTGNAIGGAPTGSVAFTVCGPLPGPALCPSGTAVPPTPVTLSPGTGITSSAASGTFTPTSVGTWCFAAVYTPDPGSNYQGSIDNTSGTADPAECLSVSAAAPGFTTTILPPSDTSVGNPWGDTATVAGNSVGGPPTGTVSWTLCQVAAPATSCTGGTAIGSDSSPTTSGDDSTFTLPNPQAPTVKGTYCFNAAYAATAGGNYTDVPQQSGTECFAVGLATSSTTTTASPTSVVIGPTGTATDAVTVTGNPTDGPPDGTVAFTVCGPLPGPALCPSGTAVPPTPVTLSPGTGITSSATSGSFMPTSVGTWCFAAVYTPATGSNYIGSSDNVTGTADPAECFSVSAATPGFTTTILPPSDTSVGNPWGDTATVVGNSAGGAPRGRVSWTLCQESAPSTPCTGGNAIGATTTSTTSGNNSTFTLPNPQAPTAVGTWCFNASYAATPGGNYASVPQQSGSECFTVIAPNFTVIKTVEGGNGSPVNPGAVVTYTILIKNAGNATGSAVVTDTMPPQFTVTTTPSCVVTTPDTCTVANSTARTWTFSVMLAPNHTATVTVRGMVAVSATGTMVNTATITSGRCIASDACSSSVSDPIKAVPSATVSPITPTQIPVTG
jgi:uncharacterized repeat protein (TIGR01451 family)